MKCPYVYFVTISLISALIPKEICETCVPTQKCPLFGNLSNKDQQLWMEKFPCGSPQKNYGVPPGFAATAKGDYVCCSNNIWGVENSEHFASPLIHGSTSKLVQTYSPDNSNYYRNNDPIDEDQGYIYINSSGNSDVEKTRQNNGYIWYPDRRQNYNNRNYWSNDNNRNSTTNNSNRNRETNFRNRYWNDKSGRQRNIGNQNINSNNHQDKRHRNENDYNKRTQIPPFGVIRPQQPQNNNNQRSGGYQTNFRNNLYPTPYYVSNNFNHSNPTTGTGQCDRITSFPPDPQSGCCGREVADDDRITDQYARNYIAPVYTHHIYQTGNHWIPKNQKRAANGNNATVRVENRISGGKATELYQYPWTVLMLTTFDYGNRQAGFNCGGSLISSKYVLSAGHCVYDKGAVVKSVVVNLAEYDKRTFPRDCKVSQQGRKCIENIVMYAENIIIHPQYENENLLNDISLIRLQGTAPYTEYIRPICLPSINIDEPQFSNLQFEVAGWGRNGEYSSNVKQATVLHLVNQNECKRFYPMLTTKHLCAAGYKGEDTCKGDSGGPLMTVYRGRYYVTGAVSGKRADSPCGTAVPSLYTNVYHYLDWIQSNIRN